MMMLTVGAHHHRHRVHGVILMRRVVHIHGQRRSRQRLNNQHQPSQHGHRAKATAAGYLAQRKSHVDDDS